MSDSPSSAGSDSPSSTGADSPSSPGAISRQQIEHVASLARLELSADEAEAMTRDLGRILEYVETLEGLDTDGIEPTSHAIPLDTPVRADEPAPPMDPDAALSNAPDRDGDAFVVPKVLDSDEEG